MAVEPRIFQLFVSVWDMKDETAKQIVGLGNAPDPDKELTKYCELGRSSGDQPPAMC